MAQIGIDLGTTNCVVAYYHGPDIRTISVDGSTTMPSVVSVDQSGRTIVGKAAKNRALAFPHQTISSSKRRIGDGFTTYKIGTREFTPVSVATLVLEKLKAAAEEELGTIEGAVVTVPAYFDLNQKSDTADAVKASGLELIRLLTEPEAAAISYVIDRRVNQKLLVYDLGGGTFDVTVLQVEGDEFRTLAINGDMKLGGNDFDRIIGGKLAEQLSGVPAATVRRLLEYLSADPSESHEDDKSILMAAQTLVEVAEHSKIDLAEVENTEVLITNILGGSLNVQFSRDELNKLIAPLIDKTIALTRATLKEAKLGKDDIDKVLLVGGSTKLVCVRERLAAEIKPPWASPKVDEAVAHGAAFIAAATGLEQADGVLPDKRTSLPRQIQVHGITAHSFGVRITDEDENPDFHHKLITRGTPIPKTASHTFTTGRHNQSAANLLVFQGESDMCQENTFIGGFVLEGIPAMPAGIPEIEVKFTLNISELLEVSASCESAQNTTTLSTNKIANLEEFFRATNKPADVVFLIDTSGSMSDELAAVKQGVNDFANSINEAGVPCRLGVMAFAIGSSYNWEVIGPMGASDLTADQNFQNLRIGYLGYGGCYLGDHESLKVIEALGESFTDSNRVRIAVIISDETCKSPSPKDVSSILSKLKAAGVVAFVLGVADEGCHRDIAEGLGGVFWDISKVREGGRADFTEVLEHIAMEVCNLAYGRK